MEELAKVNAALPTCVGIHADITAPYLTELGTDEQKKRWLPGVASGEILLAIGMTEPSGGSDLAALRTTAVRDGDEWVINGSKTFITNGYSCDLTVVAARTAPELGPKGITLFGVESTKEGFERGRKLDKVGMEESDTSEMFFENLRVTDAEIIGELNKGFIHMMQKLPQERLGCSVSNLAHAKQILHETLQYAKDRQAFGVSIGSLQYNKFLLAEMFTQIEVCEAFVDRCVEAHAAGELTADRRREGQVVVVEHAERRAGRLRAAARRLRLHERVPRGPRLARRPGHQDLGRLQRDHEGAHRPRPGPVTDSGTDLELGPHEDEPHERGFNDRLSWLRAGVLGANDGIVSTAGIVLGVAGATSDRDVILVAGVAGLVAGAISMAAGEYVSVSTPARLRAGPARQGAARAARRPRGRARRAGRALRRQGPRRGPGAARWPPSSPPTTRSARTPRRSWASTPTTSPALERRVRLDGLVHRRCAAAAADDHAGRRVRAGLGHRRLGGRWRSPSPATSAPGSGSASAGRAVARNVAGGLFAMLVTYGVGTLIGPHV